MSTQTPFAITLDPATSLLNHTGSWRTRRPEYVSRLPPCNHACPVGEATQAWLAIAEEGRYEDAWRKIMEENPFPATMGRICYHPCEQACNRAQLDEAVGINSVERFLGEQASVHGWGIESAADTGKRVMIIGGGPAGLACAYHLRRLGHGVWLYDANAKLGGMMRYGIPKYRLPRERLVEEIARIERLGVQVELNARIDDIAQAQAEGGFDAVFIATGAPLPRRIEIPSDGSVQMLDAVKVLRDVEEERPTRVTGDVIVIGGGNTAMDVARSAVRSGARSVTVLVLEAQEHMAAHPQEVREAREEGVRIENLRAVRRIEDGKLIVERMSATNERWPRPLGEFDQVQAMVLVQAVGQQSEFAPIESVTGLKIEQERVGVDANMATGADGVFAGGDLIPTGGSATCAIGHGKRAARAIDAYLNGEVYRPPAKSELASFEALETWYYSDAPRSHRPRLDLVRRTSGFAEVVGNLDTETAAYEARRCMSCGNCFECDNCYGVCPDNAITKLGPGEGFAFKYDYCKGCGLCVSECPCGAITAVPEN